MYLIDSPRKPFIARGSKTQRCERCRLRVDLCICAECQPIASRATFWLLTHHNEFYKPSNTGRLILSSVAGSASSEWSRQVPGSAFQALLDDSSLAPCIVFPGGADYQHRMISNPLPSDGRRPVFIILDGTWRQARRMFRHSRSTCY
ncbi:DTW domain-containing protein [Nitrincola sp. MINF-07-Sa-05]|uniref:DTW domain-containing protein n=1 Tax=Nitrincola salilacus TaxID=3400273 RepID=UPI0039186529